MKIRVLGLLLMGLLTAAAWLAAPAWSDAGCCKPDAPCCRQTSGQKAPDCCKKDAAPPACCKKDAARPDCCKKDATAPGCCKKDAAAPACCKKDAAPTACCAKNGKACCTGDVKDCCVKTPCPKDMVGCSDACKKACETCPTCKPKAAN